MSLCYNRHARNGGVPDTPQYNFADLVNFGGNQGQPVPPHYVHGLTHDPPAWVTEQLPVHSLPPPIPYEDAFRPRRCTPFQRSEPSDSQFLFGLNNRNPRPGNRGN